MSENDSLTIFFGSTTPETLPKDFRDIILARYVYRNHLRHEPLHFNHYLEFCVFFRIFIGIDVQDILENRVPNQAKIKQKYEIPRKNIVQITLEKLLQMAEGLFPLGNVRFGSVSEKLKHILQYFAVLKAPRNHQNLQNS